MQNAVKISVICSAFNRAKYINQCVESILNQSLKEIELILIDNGSSDATGEIIDGFAEKDSRVLAIHNPQGTSYGKALNQGISLAKGDYIGIVESDDWIDPTMYEKLYAKISQYQAEVAMCSFTRILVNGQRLNEHRLLEYAPKNRSFSIDANPRMWYLHPCIWAKLYAKKLIKKIQFNEEETYLDQPFIARLFTESLNFVCVPEYLYFYRQDNESSSSAVTRHDKSLIGIVDAFSEVIKILQEKGVYEKFKEHTYYHATYVIRGWLDRIDKKYRLRYLKAARCYYLNILNDKEFCFKFFNKKETMFVKNILARNWDSYKYDRYHVKRFLRIPFYKEVGKDNWDKIKVLGITIKQKRRERNFISDEYLSGVFGRRKFDFYTEFRVFNVKFGKRISLRRFLTCLVDRQNKDIRRELQRAVAVYSLHQTVFPGFRNIYRGRDIVVCGAGPTLSAYSPLPKCIHIGVNRVFMNSRIPLDYLFLLDFPAMRNALKSVAGYRIGKCKKFYGQLLEQNHPFFIPDGVLPEQDVYRYWVDDSTFTFDEDFHYDLSTQTLPCFFSIIFQAISFALWTHPKQIFLVGCDANFNGHFDGTPMASNDKHWQYLHHERNYDGWNKLKKFLSVYYPDVKIISINPVGLKGMFSDMYTQEYLDKNPRIKVPLTSIMRCAATHNFSK